MKENLILLPDSPYSVWIKERSEKVAPGISEYVYFSTEVKYDSTPNVLKQDYLLGLTKSEAQSFKRVIIHYHNELVAFFLEKNKISPKNVFWVLWSGDLYNSPFYSEPLYQEETLKLISIKKQTFIYYFKEFLKKVIKKRGFFVYKKSFRRIKYIASFFDGDVLAARKTFNFNYNHIPFAFLAINQLVDKDILESNHFSLGNKLMVGHAGSMENNHLDTFKQLKKLNVSNVIFSPLSYGSPDYIKIILESGYQYFGDQFEPLTEFIPKHDYYNKLQEVGFAIFNTEIQQAFGNIMALVYLGVKVFLNGNNSIFKQLKSWGVTVFDVSELSKQSLEAHLLEFEKEANRSIIFEKLNEDAVNTYYKGLLTY
ncbi:TDP-N-acetylfucosamine:lipid II N-acetylfucosaminyltransferase [Penaeicola halotolerans]|uniref:TDP-N-acetylfucosamine:lipid II N-acetylfucosaminyltransferase n=1 Tax=Penaeicola halotolerans TaxID=2793196 RepID=UPI001CF85203|nr:TDP-N-acetylfucosamine:lipid II N-acetylfucosaminyltransferase [Penaeicola halotolerans]